MSMFFGIVQSKKPAIGDSLLGGKIVYVYQSGDPIYDPLVPHGLVAFPNDVTPTAGWGCSGTLMGSSGLLLGDGQDNSNIILSTCFTVGIAAQVAFNVGPPYIWFLPSLAEMVKVWTNRSVLTGFTGTFYWTSSELNATAAYYVRASDGLQTTGIKTSNLTVRPITYF